jgi:hypothetical protein
VPQVERKHQQLSWEKVDFQQEAVPLQLCEAATTTKKSIQNWIHNVDNTILMQNLNQTGQKLK